MEDIDLHLFLDILVLEVDTRVVRTCSSLFMRAGGVSLSPFKRRNVTIGLRDKNV